MKRREGSKLVADLPHGASVTFFHNDALRALVISPGAAPYTLNLVTGEEGPHIEFHPLRDAAGPLAGMELSGCWVDEMDNIPTEDET